MSNTRIIMIKERDRVRPCPYGMIFYDKKILVGSEECTSCRYNQKTTKITVDCNRN